MNTKFDPPNGAPCDVSPERIARLLTRAAQQLDDRTVAALTEARHAALERQLQDKPALALSGGHGLRWWLPHSTEQRLAMIVLLAVALFGGLSYWQHTHENELAYLDIAILTDDLPLEVFVD